MTDSARATSDAEITLAHDLVSPRTARRFLRQFIEDARVDCDLDTADLLVSEVVTNAVLHARGAITVYVAALAGGVRVEVHDCSPLLPAPRRHADDATTGRGLDLVSTLASGWGAHTLHGAGEDRKVVWFELTAGEPGGAAGRARGARGRGPA